MRAAAKTLLTAAAVGLLAGLADAQARGAAVLLLRDPSGAPVADADGMLLLGPARDLPALRGVAFPGGAAVDPTYAPDLLRARSDARGVLRFAADAAPRAGAAVVLAGEGLGTVMPWLRPGEAQRVTLQPLGEVAMPDASESMTLHAAVLAGDGQRRRLPPLQGAALRLPAGSYESWLRTDDGWQWLRLLVEPGRRTAPTFAGAGASWLLPADAQIHPEGWPELRLDDLGERRVTLRGAARQAPLVARDADGRLEVRSAPIDGGRAWPLGEPRAARTLRIVDDRPTAAHAFVLRRADSGAWTALAAAAMDAHGQLTLPESGDGEQWLLVLATDRAPFAAPWPTADALRLALRPGTPLTVQCRSGDGQPAVDVVLEYVPTEAPPATMVVRSNGRGEASFGPQTVPGELRVSDPRYANQTLAVGAVPLAGIDLQLDAGAKLLGLATWSDGAPAAGALVTLRDPTGTLRPAERAVRCADDGSFAFEGLDEGAPYVLFASLPRDGRTWSGKIPAARAGGAPHAVVLRDEDPQLDRRPPGAVVR